MGVHFVRTHSARPSRSGNNLGRRSLPMLFAALPFLPHHPIAIAPPPLRGIVLSRGASFACVNQLSALSDRVIPRVLTSTRVRAASKLFRYTRDPESFISINFNSIRDRIKFKIIQMSIKRFLKKLAPSFSTISCPFSPERGEIQLTLGT